MKRKFPEAGGLRHAEFKMVARSLSAEELKARGVKDGEEEEDGKGRRFYEVAISSETEVERWFGLEVLGHGSGEIDTTRMMRGAAVLIDHIGDQVGVVEPGTFSVGEDKVARALIRFSGSQRGQEVERDVQDEIRTNISVGYFVKKAKLVEQRQARESGEDKVDVWRVTRWTPAEVSLVSVPADVTVGVGRSNGADDSRSVSVETEDGEPVAEDVMKKVRNEKGEVVLVPDNDPREAVVDVVREDAATLAARNAEVDEILSFCESNGIEGAEARGWVREGLTAGEVARLVVNKRKTKGDVQPAAEKIAAAMKPRDRRSYSYVRAIRLGAGLVAREKGDNQEQFARQKFDGLEAEVHQELEAERKAWGMDYRGGILVPLDLRTPEERAAQYATRTLDSKTVTKGTETVYEQPGEMIELLRNQAVIGRLGARFLGGLSGPVAFTKQTGGLTVYWVGENPAADVTSSDVAFGLVNLAPKTMQATTAYSRQLLVQSSVDIEAMIREEFSQAHALKLDKSGFYGLGAAGEPTGIYKAPDVKVRAAGGAPDLADIMDLVIQIAEANALLGNLGWAMTPGLAGKLRQTLEFSAAGAQAIWTGTMLEGQVVGYRAIASNQLSKTMTGSEETGGSEHGAIFANWSDMIVGLFASMELIVDPYAQKKRGLIEVTSFQMADLILRHGESFGKFTGATA